MATQFSTYLGNAIINAALRNVALQVAQAYVSLHTGLPGLIGSNEVVGGSYIRQAVTFGAAGSKASDNTTLVEFTGMPACTVTDVGLWDTDTGGNFLWGGTLSASKVVNAGDTFQIAIGALDVSVT